MDSRFEMCFAVEDPIQMTDDEIVNEFKNQKVILKNAMMETARLAGRLPSKRSASPDYDLLTAMDAAAYQIRWGKASPELVAAYNAYLREIKIKNEMFSANERLLRSV